MNGEQKQLTAACVALSVSVVLLCCFGCSSERAVDSDELAEMSGGQQREPAAPYPVPVDAMQEPPSFYLADEDEGSSIDAQGLTDIQFMQGSLDDSSEFEAEEASPVDDGSAAKSFARNAMRDLPEPAEQGGGPGGAAGAPTERRQTDLEADLFLRGSQELWVIAAAEPSAEKLRAAAETPDLPGCGALIARLPDQQQHVPVPLKHTDVTATIDGYIASVNVKQQFHNPFDSKIEAEYLFPLPQNAAVNEFIMTVGERRIRGIIREREQAEQIYRRARSQGHVAALMTQERPNIFTQKVANIEPGKQIDIDIRYFNTLRWDDGAYEFVFPMVIGPRYNPAGSEDPVRAVARGRAAQSGNTSAVEYLAPHERSGHDIALTVDVRTGVNVERITSTNHTVTTRQLDSGHHQVTLNPADSIPNRDFVLRCRVAGETVKSALMTHRDEHGQYFTMMLYPPAELGSVDRSPMEMVFVLDCSGSMDGAPLAQAKAAIRQALLMLTPRDSFQIIRFSSNASQLGHRPLIASEQNIQRALTWLASLNGGGGTEMIEASAWSHSSPMASLAMSSRF